MLLKPDIGFCAPVFDGIF